jgi:hypothetical protein
VLYKKLSLARSAVSNIVVLPKRAPKLNRLFDRDRAEAKRWCRTVASPCYRTLEYADADEDIGDFILISRSDQAWASWGVARRGDMVLLWQSTNGENMGFFKTMALALAALPVEG